MQKYFICIFCVLIFSCKNKIENQVSTDKVAELIKSDDFQLVKSPNETGLLVLFPCFPCDAENTLNEFKIADLATTNGFSVLALNINRKLFLSENEKEEITLMLQNIIKKQSLVTKNVYFGGFSSGGNMALLISNHLIKNNKNIQPDGVFVVDSPLDLLALYKTAEKNLKLNTAEVSVQESQFLKQMFDAEFGNPKDSLAVYEMRAPFTFQTENISNLSALKNTKLRFYTEPDLQWWKEQRQNNYEDLNAYYLKQLSNILKSEFKGIDVELIETENKGYRANGERHPHSWSIVNTKELVSWMQKGN
ncbi:hypothetical protein [Neotamlana laminarinivorans]|uniref:Alpha/beta hydrolase family protein n=1 Tax=Neotamlana laminarinivorans TaxID=2883124 RepID=A0A9X1I4Y1_9FLAO|nr:hypothetical protein [Tamlana laminarinivorans]MCB4800064.1 hypothetical protein [Tamlana laminarinivorans]